jgi:hypothetical protein
MVPYHTYYCMLGSEEIEATVVIHAARGRLVDS